MQLASDPLIHSRHDGAHMTQKALMKWAEGLLMKRSPRVIATSFFSLGAFIIVVGYLKAYEPSHMFLFLLAAAAVSLIALGLRWIEKRCPAPSTSATQRSIKSSHVG